MGRGCWGQGWVLPTLCRGWIQQERAAGGGRLGYWARVVVGGTEKYPEGLGPAWLPAPWSPCRCRHGLLRQTVTAGRLSPKGYPTPTPPTLSHPPLQL